jgi:hypothetical protein
MATKQLEKDIQATICDYLTLKMNQGKLMFWRQNTGGIWNAKDQSYRAMPKYSLNGVSDIIIVKDGWAIFLEVKRKGTKQSESQLAFEKLVKQNNGEYHVVRSLEDVIELGL